MTLEGKGPMVLAILGGTGKEGPGLALRWARAGYRVIIGSRSADKASATAADINQRLNIDTVCGAENAQAAQQADIAVLTVPHEVHLETLVGLKAALCGKILVDTTAQVDWRAPVPPSGRSAARAAQDLLGPDVRVVAAFQNVPAHALQDLEHELLSDVLVCSDDAEARDAVVGLAQAAGMCAYEAGGLDNAVVVEGLTAVMITLNKRYKSKRGGIKVTGITK